MQNRKPAKVGNIKPSPASELKNIMAAIENWFRLRRTLIFLLLLVKEREAIAHPALNCAIPFRHCKGYSQKKVFIQRPLMNVILTRTESNLPCNQFIC